MTSGSQEVDGGMAWGSASTGHGPWQMQDRLLQRSCRTIFLGHRSATLTPSTWDRLSFLKHHRFGLGFSRIGQKSTSRSTRDLPPSASTTPASVRSQPTREKDGSLAPMVPVLAGSLDRMMMGATCLSSQQDCVVHRPGRLISRRCSEFPGRHGLIELGTFGSGPPRRQVGTTCP